jgi:hypothetical protein
MRGGITVFTLVLSVLAWGQQPESVPGLPGLVIRASLLPLGNQFKQSANLATDIRLNDQISVDLGAGWMLGSTAFVKYRGESYQGPRFRAGFKYFIQTEARQAAHIGVEAVYQEVLHRKYRNVLRQGGQYAQTLLDRRHVRTTGIYLRTGNYFYLSRNRRWMMEPQFGLGLRFHTVWRSNPPDVEILPPGRGTFFTFEYDEGRSNTLHLLLGLHLGYAFW